MRYLQNRQVMSAQYNILLCTDFRLINDSRAKNCEVPFPFVVTFEVVNSFTHNVEFVDVDGGETVSNKWEQVHICFKDKCKLGAGYLRR